jgi:CubicO group peptidase (beta-lactamase class C family)
MRRRRGHSGGVGSTPHGSRALNAKTAKMASVDFSALLESLVSTAMERQNIPGLSILVARAGEVVLARGFGRRNVGENLAADADTIYSIASISKQFTAAAIFQLAERGRLRVDDPLSRYVSWHPYGNAIALHHLLSHTSGIPDYFPLDDLDRIGFTEASPREIAESVLTRGPAFVPGAEYQYCNTGYVLLGAIIEAVAGQSYADYLQANVFDPLEMSRTGVDDKPAIRSNIAVGYTSFALGPWELARDYHPSWEFGTGGLYSTVTDMRKWNLALRTERVVSASSLALMTTQVSLLDGHRVNYGFGLGVTDVGDYREVRHTGGLPGISTENTTYPDVGIDIIVFVNHDGCSTYDDLPFSPKFERFLKGDRRARYAGLRAYGAVRGITLVDAARRDPETTFNYRVDFEHAPLVASLGVRDDGTIAGLHFSRWDDRA